MKLTVQTFITLDRVMQAGGGVLDLTRRSLFRTLFRERWISPEKRHARVVRGPFCRAVAREVKGGLADTDKRRAS